MEFVPIGVAILSLALALWRASALWQRTLNARAFDSAVSRLIVAGNKERALKLCRAAPKSVIANAARACLEQELAFGNDKPPTRPEQLKFAFDGAIARELRSLARQAPWAWLAIGGAAIALGLVLREDSFRVATIIVSSGAVICAAWSIVTHRRLQSDCLASQQRVLSALVDGQVFVAKTSVSGPVARMTKGALSLAVVGLIASTALPMCARGAGGCGGYQATVFETLNDCPAVTEALGNDVSPAWTGYACGSTETSSSHGTAAWRIPIAGSKNSGVLHFAAQRSSGDWTVTEAQVFVEDQTINAVTCAASGNRNSNSPIAEKLAADCDRKRQAAACYSVSKLYETGTSVPKDPVKTRHYRKKACELGFPVACQ